MAAHAAQREHQPLLDYRLSLCECQNYSGSAHKRPPRSTLRRFHELSFEAVARENCGGEISILLGLLDALAQTVLEISRSYKNVVFMEFCP